MDRIELITSNLNERQLQAVTTTEGYVRVAAGAGSGKTKALANRFAYIVEELGISPGNILCITFTNKAAQEMKRRIQSLVSSGNICDFVCTYHGFCVKFLRDEIHHLYLNSGFSILDEEDKKVIIKEVFEELKLNANEITPKQVLKAISQYKMTFGYIQYLLPREKADFSDIKEPSPYILLYLKKQLKLNALDFDDLISLTLYILNKYSEIALKWQSRFHYIMVDETQDNNDQNWALADILSCKHKNLFIVGDPDQAIYEWRGAKPEGFINFDKSHSPCVDVIMDENYRSTPNILDVANCVIKNNKNRVDKDLFTRRNEGAIVVHFHGKDEKEEGKWICETIKNKLEGDISLSQIVILYRASYLTRFIEQSLIQYGFKYVIYGGIRFFERREIKDALSYLRLIEFGDDLSFNRIINRPSRKFGKASLLKLQNLADQDGTSLYDTLKSHLEDETFNRSPLKQFVNLIEECRQQKNIITLSDLLDYVLLESGLKDILKIEGEDERLDNLDELMHSIVMYEQSNMEDENMSLLNYLQDIALYTNLDYKDDSDQIKLMTIHQSKGLEFPIVFVAGMSEGIFPNDKAIRERKMKALEEERRLAYVAFTRAEKELYLSESEGFNFASKGNKYPSRFLFEIKSEFRVIEGVLSKTIVDEAKIAISRFEEEMGISHTQMHLNNGDYVEHPYFGYGTIQFVDEKQLQYLIKFEEYDDEKPISLTFKRLRLVIDN